MQARYLNLRYQNNYYLYVGLVHFIKKVLDPVFILTVVHHDESDMSRRYERANKPLVKFIHNFQMHVRRFPRVLVHKIECRVGDELIQMRVILFLKEKYIMVESTSQCKVGF